MTEQLPQVIRTYQSHILDSTRWQHYQPRPDDIIISTPPKSGTTWMQEIVRQLVFLGQDAPERDIVGLWQVSTWLEQRLAPLDVVLRQLEDQQYRRFIKSHLPLDGIPYFAQVKYIIVGRDARDVAMSLWNHLSERTDAQVALINNTPGRGGDPVQSPEDIHRNARDRQSLGGRSTAGEPGDPRRGLCPSAVDGRDDRENSQRCKQ